MEGALFLCWDTGYFSLDMSPETQEISTLGLPATFQQGAQLLPSAQEGGGTTVPVKTLLVSLCLQSTDLQSCAGGR